MPLSPPPEPEVSRAVYKSLGLNAVLERARGDRIYSILDLGPPLERNVRFWSQFSCRLHIHDLYRGYRERKAAVGPEKDSEEAAFAALLTLTDETVFDVIFAWDLFNYFNPKELEALVRRLTRWCRPGTCLFALISAQPAIPASPRLFRILSRDTLIYEIPTRETRAGPRYQPRDIIRLMALFSVSNSFLLHHGIQEYVFEFR